MGACPFLYGAGFFMTAENIVLVGFMGAGKSTVAAALVKLSDFSLFDLDSEIEGTTGMKIREIFAQQGETVFRDLETLALEELRNKKRLIVATGGGILGRPQNRDLLRTIGRVVYLRAPFSTLQRRLKFSRERPLVKEKPDWNGLESLLLSRIPFYETADLIIDTENKRPEEIATEILQRLAEV
jgi:shikimate kinase